MGKRFRKKKGDKKSKPNEWKERNYPEVVLENKAFEAYYRAQSLFSEEEFEQFYSTLKTPLPVSFRITGSRSNAFELREYMKNELFPKLNSVVIDGVSVPPPTPIPWYPNELAWVYDCGRTALRRSPDVNEFHRFLVSETEVGNLSRQETVSMIPVQFMDIHPGQYILDMCAAPGSKTAQLLEGIVGEELDVFPRGLVIANDADAKRAYMLVHQAKRIQTPCLMVTNHDAEDFPRIIIDEQGKPSYALQFDRILCDVPCSGDGTLRKNKTIWNTWNVGNAIGLHKTQKGILRRGCELLKVGGRLVYSTCSFNPIENEAIVASILAASNGALKLVDVSDQLKNLQRYPGIKNWMASDKKGNVFSKMEENPILQESMFPPSNIEELNIERWLSCLI
jgi:16S rRNA C967 or C1407 C5-methylase (RsmB/RsmF family)